MLVALPAVALALILAAIFGRVLAPLLGPGQHRGLWLGAALILSLVGVGLVVVNAGQIDRRLASRNWPTTTGTVIESEIGHGRAYAPIITYSYQIEGSQFTSVSDGRAPGFGGKRRRFDAAETIAEEYSPGSAVTVYYDPSEPKSSTLTPGPNWEDYGQLGFGATLLCAGLCVTIMFLYRDRRSKR
jgi:hypothetical protein